MPMTETEAAAKRYPQASARVSRDVIERLTRVAEAMGKGQIPGAPIIQVSDATRAAILAGLDVLEARLGIAAPSPPVEAPTPPAAPRPTKVKAKKGAKPTAKRSK
jgi:hypothetical protein